MLGFKAHKIIHPLTLGQQLKEAREKDHFSLTRLAQESKVRRQYLEALESGQYKELPSKIYIKQFINRLAEILTLPEAELHKKFEHEYQLYFASQDTSTIKTSKSSIRPPLVLLRLMRWTVLAVVVAMVVGYLGWRTVRLVTPPSVTISLPNYNFISSEPEVEILGQTEPETLLTINGEKIWSDSQGDFTEEVSLQEGINKIVIIVKKKYRRERELVYHVLFRPSN